MLDINSLPDDVGALKRLVIEQHSAGQAKDIELREQQALIEHLRFQLAKLRRPDSANPPSSSREPASCR